jgi:hypothetical protein
MKKLIIEMVRDMVGEGNYLYFEDALKVKKTPHSPEVRIWAICVKDERIYLMDNSEQFFELEETDQDYNLVIASLFARMKVISKKAA